MNIYQNIIWADFATQIFLFIMLNTEWEFGRSFQWDNSPPIPHYNKKVKCTLTSCQWPQIWLTAGYLISEFHKRSSVLIYTSNQHLRIDILKGLCNVCKKSNLTVNLFEHISKSITPTYSKIINHTFYFILFIPWLIMWVQNDC